MNRIHPITKTALNTPSSSPTATPAAAALGRISQTCDKPTLISHRRRKTSLKIWLSSMSEFPFFLLRKSQPASQPRNPPPFNTSNPTQKKTSRVEKLANVSLSPNTASGIPANSAPQKSTTRRQRPNSPPNHPPTTDWFRLGQMGGKCCIWLRMRRRLGGWGWRRVRD